MTVNQYLLNSLDNYISFQKYVLTNEWIKPRTLADRVTIMPGSTRSSESGMQVYCNFIEFLESMMRSVQHYMQDYMSSGPFAPIMASGDPMFIDARSALEKYADILNFNTLTTEHGGEKRFDEYFAYTDFVEKAENDKEYKQTQEYKDKSAQLSSMLGLYGNYVNRKSRYYLAGRAHFPALPPEDVCILLEFSRKLSRLDSYLSYRGHRTAPKGPVNIGESIDEIFSLTAMMAFGAFVNFAECERITYSVYVPLLHNLLPIGYRLRFMPMPAPMIMPMPNMG